MSDLFPEPPKKSNYHGINGYDRYKARKAQPHFSRYDLFPKLVFEATVLSVAVDDLMGGFGLDDAAIKRVKQAQDTILALCCEVDV